MTINNSNKTPDFMEALESLINEAFSGSFQKRMVCSNGMALSEDKAAIPATQVKEEHTYKSIEEFTSETGKRFRMTKEQKILGLTREEAFNETYGNK